MKHCIEPPIVGDLSTYPNYITHLSSKFYQVVFYMEEEQPKPGEDTPPPVPHCLRDHTVVHLAGVENSYPPQKKSFMMYFHMAKVWSPNIFYNL